MGSERNVQQGVSKGFEPINVVEQRVGELASKGPKTRSQTFIQEEEGTIVRKKFCDGKYYEGEVVKYDPINQWYRIKYRDGMIEDYNRVEMARYKKKKQKYSSDTSDEG